MPALIVPGVARFAINQTFGGQPVVNVWDAHVNGTGNSFPTSADREEALRLTAEDILSAWSTRMRPLLADDLTMVSVSWLDLNSANGSTGAVTSGNSVTWPLSGQVTASPFPGNVAIKASKNIIKQRGRRNGRLYICGIPESVSPVSAPNGVETTQRAAWNTALGGFLSDVDGFKPENFDVNSVVVHTTGGSNGQPLTFVGTSTINSVTIDPLLATQRRRLR